MNIKKAAELSGIKTDNIRYYERIGLIPKIARRDNGLRDFSEQDIKGLQFVKHMRDTGMQIEPLQRYMTLVAENGDTIDERKAILREQTQILQREIAEKQAALDYLTYKIDHYEEVMTPLENDLAGQESLELAAFDC